VTEAFADIHKEIIELSKTGNAKAQFELYQLYARAMFNICMRMMRNFSEAEDLLQESFTEAFSKLDSFRYESSFGAWLKKIVVNKCINSLKRKKISLVLLDNLQDIDIEAEQYDVENHELEVNKVREAIEQLPDGYRVIFSLYSLEGYDHLEIAEILGISESTSKSQYMRAKNKLKEILKKNI
jgi:RNA polymerase sigma-70 factor (ECF subfamily)